LAEITHIKRLTKQAGIPILG